MVVVGDQSSGKSSVLEGLTGLSFPVASDLCTRFATQIVMRKTQGKKDQIKVSIMPGPEAIANEVLKTKLLEFGSSLKLKELDSKAFTDILTDVCLSFLR
jgi:GTPase SAR1 family protein